MKDNEKKKQNLHLQIALIIYCIIVSVSVFIVGGSVQKFEIGAHNVDLAQNIRWLNAEYDLNLVDTINGVTITSEDLYHLGVDQMRNAYETGFYYSAVFGASIMILFTLIYIMGRKDKK